jgi:hypothetical protein
MEMIKQIPELSVENIIPTGKQISRALEDKYSACYSQNVVPLISIANKNGFAITADFAHHNADDFLAITLHFFDNNG